MSTPIVRQPRCWIQIGGQRIPCIRATVHRTAKRRGDTFSATLSITHTAEFGYGIAEWVDWDPQDISVIFALAIGGGDAKVMIKGKVDEPVINWNDMLVTIAGRDKGASLTEKKRNEKFQNKKIKDIVEKIAKDHELKAVIKQEGGSDFVGKEFEQDVASLVLNRTDFEVLSSIADRIGYRWYVDGDSLYFEPNAEKGIYRVRWVPPTPANFMDANVMKLATTRNMNAARPGKHTVKSWHQQQKKLFKGISEVKGKGKPVEYVDMHNNKTQQQVDQLAKSRLKDSIRHEFTISIEAPADLSVDVRQKLQLEGTGTIVDQDYEIDSVNFEVSWNAGGTMQIEAKAAKKGREVKSGSGGEGSPGSGGEKPTPPEKPEELKAKDDPPLPPSRPNDTGAPLPPLRPDDASWT